MIGSSVRFLDRLEEFAHKLEKEGDRLVMGCGM